MTRISLILLFFSVSLIVPAQEIYWGDDVPQNWTGDWPDECRIIPELTDYENY